MALFRPLILFIIIFCVTRPLQIYALLGITAASAKDDDRSVDSRCPGRAVP